MADPSSEVGAGAAPQDKMDVDLEAVSANPAAPAADGGNPEESGKSDESGPSDENGQENGSDQTNGSPSVPDAVQPAKRAIEDGADESNKKVKTDESTAEGSVEEEMKDAEPRPEEAKPESPESKEESKEESTESKPADSNPDSQPAAPNAEPHAEPTDKSEEKSVEEMTPLERATDAANKAKIVLLPELDPATAPEPGSGLPKHQHKYALSAIRAIKRLKDAAPFVAPVDPVAQGVPHYFEYIKTPMDLGTIEKKLIENKYDTVSDLVDDYNLVVSNCIVFNGEQSVIAKMALSIAQSFKKQLSNMPTFDATKKGAQAAAQQAAQQEASLAATPAPVPAEDSAILDESRRGPSTAMTVLGPNGVPTLRRKSTIDGRPKREIRPPRHAQNTFVGSGTGEGRPRNKKFAAELRFAGQVLREMQSRKLESIAWPFLLPVDPVEQGAPTYFDVIKEPMDLSTIAKKHSEGIYYNADEFESDVRLMFRNCYTFNPEGTPVNQLGHKLEEHFDQRWLEKPVPGVHNEDSDFSDLDEEYAESGMVNPAITVLEDQLRMIRRQLKKLKKDALAEFYRRGHRKGGSALARRRQSQTAHGGSPAAGSGSSQKAAPTEMTYEMKRELRDKIDKLPEKKIATVLAIIQESMPDLGNNGQEEIELEVDALDTKTLLRLYNYAVLNRREPSKQNGDAHAGGAAAQDDTVRRRSKALSEEEHEKKIAEIESKLKEFDSAANPQPLPEAAAGSVDAASDSSEEDEQLFDSSSSEEE